MTNYDYVILINFNDCKKISEELTIKLSVIIIIPKSIKN